MLGTRTRAYVFPNTAAGGETSHKVLTSFWCHEIASEHFVSSGSSFIMDALGDGPHYVTMVNSAAQSLLTAEIISNEGLHFNCPFAAMFLAITLYTHMYFFRSHQIPHDSQRCARVVFRLK
jgi:hypothetical protein